MCQCTDNSHKLMEISTGELGLLYKVFCLGLRPGTEVQLPDPCNP